MKIGFVLEKRQTELHLLECEHKELRNELRNRVLRSRLPDAKTPPTENIPEVQAQEPA